MDRFEKYVDQLSATDTRKILAAMASSSKENEKLFLELCGNRISTDIDKVFADKVRKEWDCVYSSLDSYNEDDYGWYDYESDDNMDEDGNLLGDLNRDVHEELKDFISLLENDDTPLPIELKTEIHDDCAHFIKNLVLESWDGFSPELARIMRLLCSTDEERRALIDELKAFDDSGTADTITQLYADLGDETQSLVIKAMSSYKVDEILSVLKRLDEKGSHDTAFSLACKCYEKGNVLSNDESNGSLLGRYIIGCFGDDSASLSSFIISHRVGLKLLPELYDRYRTDGNYEMQRELMIRLVEAENNAYNDKSRTIWYSRMKEELEEEDWKKEREKLLENAERRDYARYMYLCLADGNKEKVFHEIMHPQPEYPGVSQYFFFRKNYKWGLDEDFRFSFRIADDYPDEIYEYWWKRLDELVTHQGRESYANAVYLLEDMEDFSARQDLKEDFKMRLSALAAKHKAKRLLIGMLREEGWIR